jgi:hypothetical protein
VTIRRYLRVVYLEDGQPVRPEQSDASGDASGLAVHHLLRIGQGRLPLRQRRVRKLGDHTQAFAPHGEQDEGSFVRREERVHGAAVQVVVGLHVGEQELLTDERAFQPGTGGRTYRAVATVGTDDEGAAGGFLPSVREAQAGLNPVVLIEGDELGAALHPDAQLTKPLSQYPLGLRLGKGHGERVGAVDGVERHAGRHRFVQVQLRGPDGEAGGDHLLHHPDAPHHLQAAGVDDYGPGLARRARQLVDDSDGDASPRELTGQEQADRAGPDDEHGRLADRGGGHAPPQRRIP